MHHFTSKIKSSMSLKGKVAVVTGGSKGIGRATALKLAAEGASVVINYGKDSDSAKEVVDKIGSSHALAVQADAGNVAGIESLVKQTIDRFGKIDILMPNAGVMLMRDLEHTTEEDFDRTFNLNVKGPFFLAQVHSSTSFRCKETETDNLIESCTAYAKRLAHHSRLNKPLHRGQYHARLPFLREQQRRR
jgi:NAD(P)-dependent dehydrogenase (short-subunit alcohol dehydrogenase family)